MNSPLPQMLVEAKYESRALEDVTGVTLAQLDAVFSGYDWAKKRVAVALGSRGIDQIGTVGRTAIEWLKSRGAVPIIIPAMGSHGGATPDGQREILEALGVTDKSAGAPIDPSMETVELGRASDDTRILTSRVAFEADAVLLVNRIKPHTDFSSSEIGSGLRKMCVIGLGKAEGAAQFHHSASSRGYESTLKELSSFIIGKYPSIFGLALVEDAHHRLGRIEALLGPEIPEREPALFILARDWMPTLPFNKIDLLIIDEMGKNISGAGMDTNIIERGIDGLPRAGRRVDIGAIYTRSLTPESHGNAIGLGLADVVSSKLVAGMDKQAMYTNALTAMTPMTVRIPMHFESDRECLQAAIRVSGREESSARIVRVRNTLALDRFIATVNYSGEIADRNDLSIIETGRDWHFTSAGDFDPAFDLMNQ
ncbi:MAG: nickel-dependent lactate racemase [Acidobacteria bacterium]|nr:nickel-dependent lactate racemase [Acidobacteriota bacterium]